MPLSRIAHTLALSAICLIANAFATQRIVNEYGLSGAYTTIQAAVTAAVAGDTIKINPHSSGAWLGDLILNKKLFLTYEAASNVSFFTVSGAWTVSATDTVTLLGMKQLGTLSLTGSGVVRLYQSQVNGAVTITGSGYKSFQDDSLAATLAFNTSAPGNLLELVNCQTKTISTQNAGGSGATLRILSSTITGNVTALSGYTLEMVDNIVTQGNVEYYKGDVIGNKIMNGLIGLNAGSPTPATMQIIGNEVKFYGSMGGAISVNTFNPTIVANNDISLMDMNTTLTTSKVGVLVNGDNLYSYQILHNRISATAGFNCGLGDYGIKVQTGRFTIAHNDIIGYLTTMIDATYFLNNSIHVVAASYASAIYNNIYNSPSITGTWDVNTGNTVVDNSDGLTPHPSNVNTGSPEPQYNDINGSRADIGIEGGATPFSQYPRTGYVIPANRRARTFEIQAPRVVQAGQSITIKARAFDH